MKEYNKPYTTVLSTTLTIQENNFNMNDYCNTQLTFRDI